jgi:DNA-directed RNA polymerase specialized sigma subunit
MDRKNRSDSYQPIFTEVPYSHDMMVEFAEEDGLSVSRDSEAYEEFLDCKERLVAAFWRLVNNDLTSRQKEVIHLYCQRLTQTEIAKKLNVNQSSITKSLNGNCDYRNGKRVRWKGAKDNAGDDQTSWRWS